MPIEATG